MSHAPLSVSHNAYTSNPKDSSVFTPKGVAQFIADISLPYLEEMQAYHKFIILDPACGSGRLLAPFQNNLLNLPITTIGIDPVNHPKDVEINGYSQSSFFSSDVEDLFPIEHLAMIICNPPFNNNMAMGESFLSEYGKKTLIPFAFLDRMRKLYGNNTPIVLMVPMGFRLNQKVKSARWKSLRDASVQITSILSLPLDIYPNVEFHNEVLFFNMPMLEPHYFLPDEYINYDV